MNITEKLAPRETNTEFRLTRNGCNVPLWSENFLGRFLRRRGMELRLPVITGAYVPVLATHNLITNVGHAGANGIMSGQGGYSAFTYMAIGTGATAAAATDTTLQTEITTNGGQRATGTATQVTTTVTNDTTQLAHTWTFTGSFAITEEGILDAVSSGHLLARQVFAAINVVSGDSLTVTHKYST